MEDQLNKQELHTVYFWGDVGGAPPGTPAPWNMFAQGLHLPFGVPLRGFYIENHGAAANLIVTFGADTPPGIGGYGNIIIKFGTGKRLPVPEHVTSLSVWVSTTSDTGLVMACLSSDKFAPSTNTSI